MFGQAHIRNKAWLKRFASVHPSNYKGMINRSHSTIFKTVQISSLEECEITKKHKTKGQMYVKTTNEK